MGNIWGRLCCRYSNKEEIKILSLGLDAAGKTSILYKIKLGEVVSTIPTIGFNVETLNHKGTKFAVWDSGGGDKLRPLLKNFYRDTRVVIWVVDSGDRERVSECKDELWQVLKADELRDAIILIMANKQDLPNAMTVSEVSEKLEIQTITDRYIYVQGTCAHSGSGLYEGFDWIKEALTRQKLQKSATKPVKELMIKEK